VFRRIALALVAGLAAAAASLALIYAAMQPPRLPVPARGVFTLRDVTLVNPGLERRERVDIEVADGVVRAVVPTRAVSEGTPVPCPGCFALPGLIDMHAHLPPRVAVGNDRLFSLLFLSHGVTMIREIGSADGSAYAVRDAIADGRHPGPRVVSCGWVLDGDPPTRANNVVLRTPDEGRAAVADAVRHGARCVKLYNMLRRDVVLAIADAAARAGIPVVAHVPHSVSLLDAPYLADVQHLTGVPVPADPDKVGLDDYLNEDFAALTDERIDEVVAAALRQGTIHTPALVNEEVRRTLGDPELYPPDPEIAILPDFWRTVWRALWPAPNLGAEKAVYEGFLARDRAAVAAMFRAGVTVHAGTDTLMPFVAPGAALETELRDFAALGLTPEQALATATTTAGRFWKDRVYGRVAPGLPADVALYREDPSASLDALESLELVVADGRLYPKRDLDAWVARYRDHFHGWLYGHVMGAVAGLLQGGFAKGD
jgi:hypothetical protein